MSKVEAKAVFLRETWDEFFGNELRRESMKRRRKNEELARDRLSREMFESSGIPF